MRFRLLEAHVKILEFGPRERRYSHDDTGTGGACKRRRAYFLASLARRAVAIECRLSLRERAPFRGAKGDTRARKFSTPPRCLVGTRSRGQRQTPDQTPFWRQTQ